MSTVSVLYPVQPDNVGSVVPFARLVQERLTGRLWLGQSLMIETHSVFAALAGMGMGIGFGSAVTLTPMRHPLAAAACARSVAAISAQPYVAGVGPGAAMFQRSIMGEKYPRPVAESKAYARAMRTLLDGGSIPAGAALAPMEHPPVEIGLGVLRRPMSEAAGEVADVAITWLAPLSWITSEVRSGLERGAGRSGRKVPRIAAVIQCVVERPGRDMAEAAFHGAGRHLSLPHYVSMLQGAGISCDVNDPKAGARTLVSEGVVASGTPQEIAEHICRYWTAGVDEVVINTGGIYLSEGPGAALRDAVEILDAIDSVSRG